MLVLRRKLMEEIIIGDGAEQIVIQVCQLGPNAVLIGIDAPRAVPVHRGEVYERVKQEVSAAK